MGHDSRPRVGQASDQAKESDRAGAASPGSSGQFSLKAPCGATFSRSHTRTGGRTADPASQPQASCSRVSQPFPTWWEAGVGRCGVA